MDKKRLLVTVFSLIAVILTACSGGPCSSCETAPMVGPTDSARATDSATPGTTVTIVPPEKLAPDSTAEPADPTIRYLDPVYDVEIQQDIVYGEAVNEDGELETLLLDLYLPVGDAETQRPAFVWVHGGGYTSGDKLTGRGLCTALARRGYVTLSINYRLSSDRTQNWTLTRDNAEEDARGAIAWLRENATEYGVDPDAITIGGSSAGGMIVLNLAYAEREFSGGTDRSDVRAVVCIFGSRFWGELDSSGPPVLFIHGTEDQSVPYHLSVDMAEDLTGIGVYNELFTMEGAGHGYMDHFDEVVLRAARFLYVTLGSYTDPVFQPKELVVEVTPGERFDITLVRAEADSDQAGELEIPHLPEGWQVEGEMAFGAGVETVELTIDTPADYVQLGQRILLVATVLEDGSTSESVIGLDVSSPVNASIGYAIGPVGEQDRVDIALTVANQSQELTIAGTVVVSGEGDEIARVDLDPLAPGETAEFALPSDTAGDLSIQVDLTNGFATAFNQTLVVPDFGSGGNTGDHFIAVDGLVSIEAEHYDRRIDKNEQSWELVSPDGASGGEALQALPSVRVGNPTPEEFTTLSPQLDYRVYFPEAGTYYIWVRGIAEPPPEQFGSDSIHVGLNGQPADRDQAIQEFRTSWTWSNTTRVGTKRAFEVSSPGVYDVTVWMREDGFTFDKIVLTTDPGFSPRGEGPDESSRALAD